MTNNEIENVMQVFDKKLGGTIQSLFHHFKGDVEKLYYWISIHTKELDGFIEREFVDPNAPVTPESTVPASTVAQEIPVTPTPVQPTPSA